MQTLLFQPLFSISVCIFIGHYLGNIGYKYFKLGTSSTLFVGLLLSYFTKVININLSSIPPELFNASLIGFIVPVGLSASKNINAVIKDYGFKFLAISIIVTMSGALSTNVFSILNKNLNFQIIGTYVGALTSSPWLATAIELSKQASSEAASLVGLGYAISYIPGVLVVILFSQFIALQKKDSIPEGKTHSNFTTTNSFELYKFIIVIILGIIIGSLEIPLGKHMVFSLGITGGSLLSALILGSSNKGFEFDNRILNIIKNLSLNVFLAVVGLNYGYSAISSIRENGLILLFIGTITGLTSITSGYIFGKYILKMNRDVLIGAICGSMTSTPGLAAALEASDSKDVVIGYGATYPFALFTVILFTNYMFR